MGNMSYCRFRNTLQDLRDCYDNMGEIEDTEQEAARYDSETAARKRLIELCCDIALAYGDEVEREVREI